MIHLLALLAAALAPADLAVVGVVIGTAPERRVAVVRSSGQTRIVKVGDAAFGGRVAAIELGTVSFDFEGTAHEVRLRAKTAPGAFAAAAAAPAGKLADDTRTMLRDDVQRRLSTETPMILSQTAIAPATSGGFQITRLPPGANLLADAGLRPGDIVQEINGVAIDSLPTLIGLWPRLQSEREIRAKVIRGGQPLNLSVTLR